MKDPSIKTLLGHIYNEQVRTNRYDRLKALERENELLRGDNERIWERIKALEKHLEVEYVKDAKYTKT